MSIQNKKYTYKVYFIVDYVEQHKLNTGVFLTFIFLNLCTYCIQVEYIYIYVCKRNVDLVSICGIYLKSYVHMYMYLHNLALLIINYL